jgi:hypothetical protein
MSAIIRRTLLTCATVLCTDQTLWISVEHPSRIMCVHMRACARTLWGRASPPPKQQRSESEKTESEKRWKNLDRSPVDRPSGAADQLDRTTRAASSRPRPNGTRRLTLEHDQVGTRSMADRGYVPDHPATQCEGTCARDCNYLISAVVTKPGPTAKERCYSYVALIEYKPQHCQLQ